MLRRQFLMIVVLTSLAFSIAQAAESPAPGNETDDKDFTAPVTAPSLREVRISPEIQKGRDFPRNFENIVPFVPDSSGMKQILATTYDDNGTSGVGILAFSAKRNKWYESSWWSDVIKSNLTMTLRFADLDDDDVLELVAGDDKGRLHIFKRSKDGYDYQGAETIFNGDSILFLDAADVDKDGGDEIVAASDRGEVVIVDFRPWEGGFVILEPFELQSAPTGLTVGDLDSNGWDEVAVASRDGEIVILKPYVAGFKELWRGSLIPAPIRMASRVTDTDGDGIREIAAADGLGRFVILEWNEWGLIQSWSGTPSIRVAMSIAVGDVDGDSVDDIVIGFVGGDIEVLGCSKGHDEYFLKAGFRDFGDGAEDLAVADLDLDGGGEILATRAGNSGKFSIFDYSSVGYK